MSKKSAKKKGNKPDRSLRLSLLIFGSFLLCVAATVYFQVTYPQNPCANSISCVKDLSGTKEPTNTGTFMGRDVTAPVLADKPVFARSLTPNVLAATTGDYKRIYVDLTNQKLYAYEGNNRVFNFDISSGKWGWTPTGNFRIWIWLRYTRMTGGSGATYYDLPNVPYTMFFYNNDIPKIRGYALHGAYWHNNFGHPMSHGCINLRPEDAGKLFYWTNPTAVNTAYPTKENPGTLITIYGTAPNE